MNTNLPRPPNSNSSALINANSNSAELSKASLLPLFFALLAILASSVMSFIFYEKALDAYIFVIGYLLTPFAVVVAMGWDTIAQRKGQSRNPWFIPRTKVSRILRILTAVSFFVALPHIWRLAQIIADYVPTQIADLLSKFFGQ